MSLAIGAHTELVLLLSCGRSYFQRHDRDDPVVDVVFSSLQRIRLIPGEPYSVSANILVLRAFMQKRIRSQISTTINRNEDVIRFNCLNFSPALVREERYFDATHIFLRIFVLLNLFWPCREGFWRLGIAM